MFRLLIRVRLLSLYNVALLAAKRSRLLSSVYIAGGTILFLSVFTGFRLFLGMGDSAPGGTDQMVHDLFHFLFLFVLAGAVPFVASTLLQAGDYLLLSAAPIPPSVITAAKLLDATVTNSLQFTVIGIPAIAACGSELHLSLVGWPVLLYLLVLFLLLPALATALLLLIGLTVFGMRRLRRVVGLANISLATYVCLTMMLEAQRLPIRRAIANLSSLRDMAPTGPHAGPSGWFSSALLDAAHGRAVEAATRIGWLTVLVASLFLVCMTVGGRILSAATMAEEGEGERPRAPSRDLGIEGRLLRFLLPAPAAALVAKDLRYTARDSVLMGQLALPLILYLVPFVLAPSPAIHMVISWTDIGYVSLVMTGIVVFMQTSILSLSSVGLEGRSFWIQKCAPNRASVLVAGKFASSLLISAGTGLTLTLFSAIVFNAGPLLTLLECSTVLLACIALCGLGVGLSAMLPRFVYENPAHRVSVWALILGFVGSVFYVFASGLLFAVIYVFSASAGPNSWILYALGLALFCAISLLTAIVPMVMGAHRLEQYQWEY